MAKIKIKGARIKKVTREEGKEDAVMQVEIPQEHSVDIPLGDCSIEITQSQMTLNDQ